MCVVDFDPPEFLLEQWRTSRKGFRCSDCWTVYPARTRYLHVTGKWDGTISSHKRCDLCHEIALAVDAAGCSWAYGSVIDDAKEALDEHYDAPPEALGRLVGLLWLHQERALWRRRRS